MTKQDALFKILLRGLRRMQLRYRCRRGQPIILKGDEGIILKEMLEVAAMIENDKQSFLPHRVILGPGSVFLGRSPIYCEHELSTQFNTYHGYVS